MHELVCLLFVLLSIATSLCQRNVKDGKNIIISNINNLNNFRFLAQEIKGIPGLKVLGNPQLCIVAFTSEPEVHPYLIADEMGKRKWGLSRLQHPNCIHFYITPAHLRVSMEIYLKSYFLL